MSQDSTLEQDICEMLERLRAPLTAEERTEGWDIDLKQRWLKWFEELYVNLQNGRRPDKVAIGRAMDFSGVGRTPIATLASRISERLNRGDQLSS